MKLAMGGLSAVFVLAAGVVQAASAEGPHRLDCDALKNSLAPFEVSWTAKDASEPQPNGIVSWRAQVFRSGPLTSVVWMKEVAKDGLTIIGRADQENGFSLKVETAGRLKEGHPLVRSRTTESRPIGGFDPKGFDYDRSVAFHFMRKISNSEMTTSEFAFSTELRLLRTEDIRIGPCTFKSSVFESRQTSPSDQEQIRQFRYLPELQLRILKPIPSLEVDDITLDFTPLNFDGAR